MKALGEAIAMEAAFGLRGGIKRNVRDPDCFLRGFALGLYASDAEVKRIVAAVANYRW
jgi:hypothetical protein